MYVNMYLYNVTLFKAFIVFYLIIYSHGPYEQDRKYLEFKKDIYIYANN